MSVTSASNDILWAIFYLAEASDECLEELMDIIDPKCIVDLVGSANDTIQAVALKIVGRACVLSNMYKQDFLEADCLSELQKAIHASGKYAKTAACLILKSIAAGNVAQIQNLISKGVIKDMVGLIERSEDGSVREDAIGVVANICMHGNDMQVWQVINQGILQVLVEMLRSKSPDVLLEVLKAIEKVLEVGDFKDHNEIAVNWQEMGGVEAMEKLETHSNREVYEKVVKILDAYYTVEEVEELIK